MLSCPMFPFPRAYQREAVTYSAPRPSSYFLPLPPSLACVGTWVFGNWPFLQRFEKGGLSEGGEGEHG